MSRRPVSDRAMVQIAAAIVISLAVIALTVQLQRSAPTVTLAPLDELLEAQAQEVVSCERTLPGSDTEETVVGRVGRISSTDAVSCPRRFDRRIVTFIGEVVGDVLRRTDGAWVQLNDDGYAMEVGPLPAHRDFRGTNSGLAVWLPDDLLDVVGSPGRRGLRGDVIEVEGLFLRNDPDDGGGLTIRATSARRIAPATRIESPVHRPQAIAAAVAALLAILLTLRERQARSKR